MISSSEEPFRVYTRRDNSAESHLVIRFEVNEGMGVLGLRQPGRRDPEPTPHYEESDVPSTALSAGRFVHVLHSGQRQSYALSRISNEVAQRLPTDRWIELRPVTEYGFRYLVVPDEFAEEVNSAVQVAVATSPQPAARPTPVSSVDGSPVSKPPGSGSPMTPSSSARTADLPPRPVPVEPALAQSALGGLNREQAIGFLRTEMAKVQALHDFVGDLNRQLALSQARERDLLEIMSRWQRLE